MAQKPRKPARKAGRPRKPPAEKHSIEITVKFTGEAAEIIMRAVAKDADNRAHFLRRGGLKLAYEVLGIEEPPELKK